MSDSSRMCLDLIEELGKCNKRIDRYKRKLKRKEQECERLKEENFELKEEVSIDRALFEEIDQLKEENNNLKETIDGLLSVQYKLANNCMKYTKTLEEIREVLEFYANSKIGEQQEDGSYKILLNGGYIPIYDPKPAREALRKINECEGDNEV